MSRCVFVSHLLQQLRKALVQKLARLKAVRPEADVNARSDRGYYPRLLGDLGCGLRALLRPACHLRLRPQKLRTSGTCRTTASVLPDLCPRTLDCRRLSLLLEQRRFRSLRCRSLGRRW